MLEKKYKIIKVLLHEYEIKEMELSDWEVKQKNGTK